MIDMRLECIGCGTDLPDDRYAILRDWCGMKCYNRHRIEAKRKARIEAQRDRTLCEWCGIAIAPERKANNRFCDKLCRSNANNARIAGPTYQPERRPYQSRADAVGGEKSPIANSD